MKPPSETLEALNEAMMYLRDLSSKSRRVANKLRQLELKQRRNSEQTVCCSKANFIRDLALQAQTDISSLDSIVPNVFVTPAVRNVPVKPAVRCGYVTPEVPWVGEETYALHLSYVRGEDPWDFVLSCTNREPRNSITSFLQEKAAKGQLQKLLASPVVGSFIVVRYFRGVVTSVDSNDLCVLKVDYGDEVVVRQDEIFYLPEAIAEVPCQSFECRLLHNDEFLKTSWCDKLQTTFKDLLSNSELIVDIDLLKSTNGLPPFFVNIYAYDENRSSSDVLVNSWVNLVINKLKMKPPAQDLFSFVISSDIILNPFLCRGEVTSGPSLANGFGHFRQAADGKCVSAHVSTLPANALKSNILQRPKDASKKIAIDGKPNTLPKGSNFDQQFKPERTMSEAARKRVATWINIGRMFDHIPNFKEAKLKLSNLEPTFCRTGNSQRKDGELEPSPSSGQNVETRRNLISPTNSSQPESPSSFRNSGMSSNSEILFVCHASSHAVPLHLEEPSIRRPSALKGDEVKPWPSYDQDQEMRRNALTLTNPSQPGLPSSPIENSRISSYKEESVVTPTSSAALPQSVIQPSFIPRCFIIDKPVVKLKPSHNYNYGSGSPFIQADLSFNVDEDKEEIDRFDGIIANFQEEYMPTDEKRICRFFRKNGKCDRWNCGREHEAKTFDVWTTDREEIYLPAFNALSLPAEGSFESLTVQHVSNSISFYSTLPREYSWTGEPVLETAADLHADMNSLGSNNTHPLILTAPQLSEVVLALGLQPSLGRRRKWLRAVVVDIIDEYHVKVFFVDFGNNDILKLKDLRKIRPQFLHLPFQAVLTTLADLSPHTDAAIKQEAVKFLEENLNGKTLIAKAVISDTVNTALEVILFRDDGASINETMLQYGLALPFTP